MRARTTAAVLLLTALAAAGDVDLGRLTARARRQAAGKLALIGIDAIRKEQVATGVRILEKVLEWEPDHAQARTQLGWRRRGPEWTREREDEIRLASASDTDYALVADLRARVEEVDAWLVKEMLRVCGKYAEPEEARAALGPLLAIAPRNADLHAALGHTQVAGRWCRPELADVARGMDAQAEAWRALSAGEAVALDSGSRFAIPGAFSGRLLVRCDGREVGTSWTDDDTFRCAKEFASAHALVRALLGPGAEQWNPETVYALDHADYERLLTERIENEEKRKDALKYSGWRDGRFFAMRTTTVNARDLYGHCTGFWTLSRLVAPPAPDDPEGKRRAWDDYAWIKEGTAYFVTLELWDSATSWFSSSGESSGKIRTGTPRPDPLTRDQALAWIRGEVEAGAAPPLRRVLGSSLNNLDRFESLMGWTFLRFLALLDGEALRRLPDALRARSDGAQADRAEAALAEVYGRPFAELERLWRAWLLELS